MYMYCTEQMQLKLAAKLPREQLVARVVTKKDGEYSILVSIVDKVAEVGMALTGVA